MKKYGFLYVHSIMVQVKHGLLLDRSRINWWKIALIHQRHYAIVEHLFDGLELQPQAFKL